jgi:hypothetical protein
MLAFTPAMEYRIAPLVYIRICEVVRGDHPAEYNTMTNFASHFEIEDRIKIQDLVATEAQGQLEPTGTAMVGVDANHDIQSFIVSLFITIRKHCTNSRTKSVPISTSYGTMSVQD